MPSPSRATQKWGVPPTPPVFSFRLRRAVTAIVDEDGEDDDDDDENQACGQIHSDFGAGRRRRYWVDGEIRFSERRGGFGLTTKFGSRVR